MKGRSSKSKKMKPFIKYEQKLQMVVQRNGGELDLGQVAQRCGPPPGVEKVRTGAMAKFIMNSKRFMLVRQDDGENKVIMKKSNQTIDRLEEIENGLLMRDTGLPTTMTEEQRAEFERIKGQRREILEAAKKRWMEQAEDMVEKHGGQMDLSLIVQTLGKPPGGCKAKIFLTKSRLFDIETRGLQKKNKVSWVTFSKNHPLYLLNETAKVAEDGDEARAPVMRTFSSPNDFRKSVRLATKAKLAAQTNFSGIVPLVGGEASDNDSEDEEDEEEAPSAFLRDFDRDDWEAGLDEDEDDEPGFDDGSEDDDGWDADGLEFAEGPSAERVPSFRGSKPPAPASRFGQDGNGDPMEGREGAGEMERALDLPGGTFEDLVPSVEVPQLLDLVPEAFRSKLLDPMVQGDLYDIQIDLGRSPTARVAGKKVPLCDDGMVVSQEDMDYIIGRLEVESNLGDQNRASMNGLLHRISVIRNRAGKVYGTTLRVGRHLQGITQSMSDILDLRDKSILFVGPPGSGKTTLLREIARKLSEEDFVMVVDTSNEIGGDGDVAHECLGNSRRMMVHELHQQAGAMVECMQNHAPEVMIVDEISTKQESDAAQLCKNRGVRIITSTNGDLQSLVRNKKWWTMLGNIKQKRSKDDIVSFRSAEPTFDVIVELRFAEYNQIRVITDASAAVDAVLKGSAYTALDRRLDAENRVVWQKRVMCSPKP